MTDRERPGINNPSRPLNLRECQKGEFRLIIKGILSDCISIWHFYGFYFSSPLQPEPWHDLYSLAVHNLLYKICRPPEVLISFLTPPLTAFVLPFSSIFISNEMIGLCSVRGDISTFAADRLNHQISVVRIQTHLNCVKIFMEPHWFGQRLLGSYLESSGLILEAFCCKITQLHHRKMVSKGEKILRVWCVAFILWDYF